MSDDFWAGYISGAVGILIGNPLDLIKVRLQAETQVPHVQGPHQPLPAGPTLSSQQLSASSSPPSVSTFSRYFPTKSSLLTGTAAPIVGYGALNAILFVAYNRTEEALNRLFLPPNALTSGGLTTGSNLWTTWLAGAAGGVATWVISTPTDLVKCRAQLAPAPSVTGNTPSSYRITQHIIQTEGVRGLYQGGIVTVLRDSIGYGFYFWAYEISGRLVSSLLAPQQPPPSSPSSPALVGAGNTDRRSMTPPAFSTQEILKALVCGGIAGVVTWATVFPLDVVKTRVQGQVCPPSGVSNMNSVMTPLLETNNTDSFKRKGALQIAREAYREGGTRVFFRGLMVCSLRAFVVNAVQWVVYEWAMLELGQRDRERLRETHYSN
ncbi:mitochondrial carrier [Xylariaceae sp. FL0594]|nr:mitochondrial carrier [Xylariaceae sp. FL0594]